MCIQQISSNVFPCNTKPTSILASTSLVVAVVAGALIGVSFALNWGMPAIYSLAATTGVAALIALAIIICKKPTFLSSKPQECQNTSEKRLHAQKTPYEYAKDGDLENFTKSLGDTDVYDRFFKKVVSRDSTLFERLMKDDNWDCLDILLRKINDGVFDEPLPSNLFRITESQLIELFLKKMHPVKIVEIIQNACSKGQSNWMTVAIKFAKCSSIESICTSKYDPKTKLGFLEQISKNEGTSLDLMTSFITLKASNRTIYMMNATVLHIAIVAKDEELVRLLSKNYRESLVNKKAEALSPLGLATELNNDPITTILISFGGKI